MKVGILAAAVTGSCTLLYLLFRLRFNKPKDKSTFKSTTMGKNETEPLNLNNYEERECASDIMGRDCVTHIIETEKTTFEETEQSCKVELQEKVIASPVKDCSEDKSLKDLNCSIESKDIVEENSLLDLNLNSDSNVVLQKITEISLVGTLADCNDTDSTETKCSIDKEECFFPPINNSNYDNLSDNSSSPVKSIVNDIPNNISSHLSSIPSDNLKEDLSTVSPIKQRPTSASSDQGQLYNKPSFKNDISSSKSKRLRKREKKNAQKESRCDSDISSQLKTPSTTSSSSRSPSISECNSVPEVNGNIWENSKSVIDGATTSDWERETSPEQENIMDSQSLVSQASLDSGQGSIEVEPETIFTNNAAPHSSNTTTTDHYIFYQFEIPQLYVGRLIGQKGSFINKVKSTTGTSVVVLDHPNQRLKMCSVEGKKSEVSHALELIRHRFPLDEYHDVTLEQINSPSISPDHQPTINRQVLQVELPAGVVVEVQASAVVSGGELWLQQPLHPSFSALNRLHHCINLNYGDGTTAPGIPTPVQVNTVCVCRFGPQWLRCQVADSDDASCVVTLLDIGGTLRLPSSYLKQIRVDYMSLPFQATQCFLHGVMPANGTSWDEASRSALEDLTKNTILHATIAAYSQEGIPFVTLYQRQYNQYIFINEKLVEMGHAKWM